MKTFETLVLMRVLYRQGLPVWEAMEPEELARIDAAAQDILSGKPAPEPEPKKRRRKPTALEKERYEVCRLYIRGQISEEELDQRLGEVDNRIMAEREGEDGREQVKETEEEASNLSLGATV